MIQDIEIGLAIVLVLAASLECGFRLGRRTAAAAKPGEYAHLGAIQGAMLGLLALLLGFSFAGAASRFIERQDLIVKEANTIGTAWLRADLLDEPHKSQFKQSLAKYVDYRVQISRTLAQGMSQATRSEFSRLLDQIWSTARDGAAAKPGVLMAVLVPTNEVIDLHSTRMAAARKHLPLLVLGLLVASSALSMGMIGFGCGLARRRSLIMTGPLTLVIALTLWTTYDFDHPRGGLLQLSDAPLAELHSQFSR